MVHLLTALRGPRQQCFLAHRAAVIRGTAREVGTFAHRLPADMSKLRTRPIASAPRSQAAAGRHDQPETGQPPDRHDARPEDGRIKWLWVQVTNPFQSTANANHWVDAARRPDAFIVVFGRVSRRLPPGWPTWCCRRR
ncbi:MAG: hypothetical protein R2745_02360 [Vicinamibacterales bacterium]